MIILSILWLINLIAVYMKTIYSINIFRVVKLHVNLLEKNVENITKILKNKEARGYVGLRNKVTDPFSSFWLKQSIRQSNISSQIIFQIFLSTIKYNLPRDFSEGLEKHLKLLSNLIKVIHVENYEQVVALRVEDKSIDLFETILQKANLLLSNTTKNLWDEETAKIISFYHETIPGMYQINKELFESVFKSNTHKLQEFVVNSQRRFLIYYKNISSVITILTANKREDNLKILKVLMDQSDDSYEYVKGTNIFTIYFFLTIQAVLKNDIKLLTDVTNLAFQLADSSYQRRLEDEDEYDINDPEDLKEISSRRYSQCKLMILSIVKAIELGHYGCAGFLIKRVVNKWKELNLNEHCLEVHDFVKNGNFDIKTSIFQLDIDPFLLRALGFNLSFSPTSFNYCYSKAMFLIYCQENFMDEMGILTIRHSELLKIDSLIFDTNINYLTEKVHGLNKEYGLIFLKDSKYLPHKSVVSTV